MKKIILTVFIMFLTNIIMFGQVKTVTYNGKEYIVGSEEYKTACIEHFNKVSKSLNEYYIATFADEESFNNSVKGRDMMKTGLNIGLGSTAAYLPVLITYSSGLIDSNSFLAITTVCGVCGLVGGIYMIVGFYKWNKWELNGRGFVYNF